MRWCTCSVTSGSTFQAPAASIRASAMWFGGWRTWVGRSLADAPVVAAQTWLARVGWRRHGLLDVGEAPRSARRVGVKGGTVATARRVTALSVNRILPR